MGILSNALHQIGGISSIVAFSLEAILISSAWSIGSIHGTLKDKWKYIVIYSMTLLVSFFFSIVALTNGVLVDDAKHFLHQKWSTFFDDMRSLSHELVDNNVAITFHEDSMKDIVSNLTTANTNYKKYVDSYNEKILDVAVFVGKIYMNKDAYQSKYNKSYTDISREFEKISGELAKESDILTKTNQKLRNNSDVVNYYKKIKGITTVNIKSPSSQQEIRSLVKNKAQEKINELSKKLGELETTLRNLKSKFDDVTNLFKLDQGVLVGEINALKINYNSNNTLDIINSAKDSDKYDHAILDNAAQAFSSVCAKLNQAAEDPGSLEKSINNIFFYNKEAQEIIKEGAVKKLVAADKGICDGKQNNGDSDNDTLNITKTKAKINAKNMFDKTCTQDDNGQYYDKLNKCSSIIKDYMSTYDGKTSINTGMYLTKFMQMQIILHLYFLIKQAQSQKP